MRTCSCWQNSISRARLRSYSTCPAKLRCVGQALFLNGYSWHHSSLKAKPSAALNPGNSADKASTTLCALLVFYCFYSFASSNLDIALKTAMPIKVQILFFFSFIKQRHWVQEPYLAPTEHARLLPGSNLVLLFLPKSVSSSSHQGNPYQAGHGINRALSVRKGICCVPAGGWSLEHLLMGVKGFCICLPRQTLLFSHPQTRQSGTAACAACRGQDKEAGRIPSTTLQVEYQLHVPEGPQGSFTGQRGEGMDQDKDHNFATPKLKLERD